LPLEKIEQLKKNFFKKNCFATINALNSAMHPVLSIQQKNCFFYYCNSKGRKTKNWQVHSKFFHSDSLPGQGEQFQKVEIYFFSETIQNL